MLRPYATMQQLCLMTMIAFQVQPFEQTATMLEDLQSLKQLHYDAASGQFLDFGNHSEAMQLQQLMYRTPQGAIVKGPLQRALVDPSQPPKLQLVPHFGYAGFA